MQQLRGDLSGNVMDMWPLGSFTMGRVIMRLAFNHRRLGMYDDECWSELVNGKVVEPSNIGKISRRLQFRQTEDGLGWYHGVKKLKKKLKITRLLFCQHCSYIRLVTTMTYITFFLYKIFKICSNNFVEIHYLIKYPKFN